jgi:hypothetical protein
MESPTPCLMCGVLFFQAVLCAAPNPRADGAAKTISESIIYDPVIDVTTDSMTMDIEGNDSLTLQVLTVYQGRKMIAPPQAVEFLMARELPDGVPDDIRMICERGFKLLVNGEAFERLGTVNIRHVDRPSTVAVATVFRADIFSRLVHAVSVQGQACGAAFVLNAEQLVGLQLFVERWPPRQ